jgi:hypothetical protein
MDIEIKLAENKNLDARMAKHIADRALVDAKVGGAVGGVSVVLLALGIAAWLAPDGGDPEYVILRYSLPPLAMLAGWVSLTMYFGALRAVSKTHGGKP